MSEERGEKEMTGKKKITISKDDYSSAFADALENLSSQLEGADSKVIISISMLSMRLIDWAWESLEERCGDDE